MKRIYNHHLIQTVLVEKTDNLILQLFRYCFVGGLAFLVDFGVLFFLTDVFHVYYLISAGISFFMGLIVNYLISIQWVFNQSKIENKLNEFTVFSIIGIIGLGLNEGLIWLLTDICHLHYLISKIITASLVIFWNFFARKIIIFSKP
jgi:putative flippase GtrA